MSATTPSIIRRPDRGLTISGTRVTLYALMDYLHEGWGQDDIREALGLSDAQLRTALDYLAARRDEVDAEYAEVALEAESNRRHWETYTEALLARRPRPRLTAEKAALYAKLAAQREQTIRDLLDEEARPPTTTVTP